MSGRMRQSKPKLEALATQAPEAVARIHALWALHGLNSLESPMAQGRLEDASPRVREQAVALVDLQNSGAPVPDALQKLAADADARVRFRTAIALGNSNR